MSIPLVGGMPTALHHAASGDAVSIAMLKKSMQMQESSAAQLLQTLPPAPTGNNPPHLGQNVDVMA